MSKVNGVWYGRKQYNVDANISMGKVAFLKHQKGRVKDPEAAWAVIKAESDRLKAEAEAEAKALAEAETAEKK